GGWGVTDADGIAGARPTPRFFQFLPTLLRAANAREVGGAVAALAPGARLGPTRQPFSGCGDRSMTAPSSPPSQIGRFQIRGELGRGGMGVVYHAFDPQLGRDVALKVPHPDLLNRPDLVARFDREVKAAARLQHPHIVPVYEAGQDGPYHFLVSASIRGESLEKACRRGPLPPKLAARVVRELALALDYAHRGGVVHRDVKCSNALL